MKNFWQKVKPFLVACFWISCSAAVIVLMGTSMMKQHRESFQDIMISIDDGNGMLFIDQNEIFQMLRDHQVNQDKTKPVNAIDYHRLEQIISENPFVKSAQVYVDAGEIIHVNVHQRLPIVRIINNQSVSYYLDEEGKRMPLSSNFTARVPVATGYIFSNAEHQTLSDSVLEQRLFTLADFIHRDSFLNALTEQIIVDQDGGFELIPLVGNYSILLGDSHNLDCKFDKLKIFYREGIHRTAMDQYRSINLKYKNEVYCTKRENADHRVSSN